MGATETCAQNNQMALELPLPLGYYLFPFQMPGGSHFLPLGHAICKKFTLINRMTIYH